MIGGYHSLKREHRIGFAFHTGRGEKKTVEESTAR